MASEQRIASAEFEIENTFAIMDRGVYVMARLLGPETTFSLTESPTLGRVPIECWCDQPRKIGSDGLPVTDCFVFKLVRAEDRALLQAGDHVFLE